MISAISPRSDPWCPSGLIGRQASNKGFTLLELVIALLVLGVVSLVVAPLLTTGVAALVEGRNHADRERQATLALERFVRDVRGAESGTLEAQDGGMTLRFVSVRDGGEVTYHLGGDQLTRSGPNGPARVLATGIRAWNGGNGGFRIGSSPVPYATISVAVDGVADPYRATGAPRQ